MLKLKQVAERAAAWVGVAVMLSGVTAAALLPSGIASADALNPLTSRSLTLSSSSPGWSYTDGSGNSYNGTTDAGYSLYAPPNSGANGQKTGNYFSFDQSTAPNGGYINGLTFQYCTTSAGTCLAPGDDGYTTNTTATGNGTVSTSTSSTTVTGTGTNFTTQLSPGVTITTSTSTYTVASIQSDTSLTITTTPTTADTNASYTFSGVTRNADSATDSDLNVALSSPTEISNTDWTTVSGSTSGIPAPDDSQGNFVVLTGCTSTDQSDYTGCTYSPDWTMSASNLEDGTVAAQTATGKNNLITLENLDASGKGQVFSAGENIRVKFFATNDNYITNPGTGAFFVKINDYEAPTSGSGPYTFTDAADDLDPTSTVNENDTTSYIVDGGVTVANVMNQSIEIQTKVLETMDFSVGTVDPDSLSNAQLTTAGETRGTCNSILNGMDGDGGVNANVLTLGNPSAENSLSTNFTYATHSYFRLSSNSSNGATVYYSGVTLSNTEQNQIDPDGITAAAPSIGTEQFGLALDNGSALTDNQQGDAGDYPVVYTLADTSDGSPTSTPLESGADSSGSAPAEGYSETANNDLNFGLSSDFQTYQAAHSSGVHDPQLYPLTPETDYGGGTGGINDVAAYVGTGTVDDPQTPAETIGTTFSFSPTANTLPVPLASEPNQVVNCVTGKVRYIANIAATTPAGIYTTKINYIAAPQY